MTTVVASGIQSTWVRSLRGFIRRQPLALVAILVLIPMVLAAVSAPLTAPFDPQEQHYDARFQPPNATYWLGTDDFGRDLLSRVMWGARVSLSVAVLAVLAGHTVGALVGLVSGYFGSWIDLGLQRLMDALMAFPTLVLALAVVAATGPSLLNVVLAIAMVEIPRSSRVIRSAVLAIRSSAFIEAAEVTGARGIRVMLRHILPNCLAPYVVVATIGLAQAILVEASLSFLGLGVPPPEPTWGGMLSGAAQRYALRAPWMVLWPGLAICLVVYAFSLIGDMLRDEWDPRLRGS